MLKKGSKLFSVLNNKCPRCHEGDFFTHHNHYNLRHFDKMHQHCNVCGQTFMPEPGFYYGAMYVSYALNVALFVTLWIAIEIFRTKELPVSYYLFIILTPGVLLMPVTFRLARLIWINFFVSYSGEHATSKSSKITLKSTIK